MILGSRVSRRKGKSGRRGAANPDARRPETFLAHPYFCGAVTSAPGAFEVPEKMLMLRQRSP